MILICCSVVKTFSLFDPLIDELRGATSCKYKLAKNADTRSMSWKTVNKCSNELNPSD